MTGVHYTELIRKAQKAEADGDLKGAAGFFEAAIRQQPLEEVPYDRLMVLYRKLKEPAKELRAVEKAIAVFQRFFQKREQPYTGKNTIGRLSKALLQSLTGSTKKSSYTLYPEPIPR